MINAVGRDIPESNGGRCIKSYQGAWAHVSPRFSTVKSVNVSPSQKILKSISEAIDAVGLRDGMTISFHHHFRNGDFVMKMVVDAIAAKGIRGLTLSPSSISAVQDCLMPHIESGVITGLETTGIRGEIGEWVTAGKLNSLVLVRTHGGRARAIETGELHIDVAFIGAPACDSCGNINGVDGMSA